jgi:hypothetical protein
VESKDSPKNFKGKVGGRSEPHELGEELFVLDPFPSALEGKPPMPRLMQACEIT